ncbi:hypothetical protein DUNSADRAFT_13134 [Dunaliella salina]|uniref:Polycomb protein VEFS-Box domain-containing protein n=1 Tax=Dunaliella salina TaxID=3046 RepID=A0ABQ7G9Z7_DUNSA|nr:hypothetical protein DUNSADRAFT_13134 [Dunaliella salina]|eukprot:KAF5831426.1 hypothetical protein DUNSADRAFT_13134 [Dunaliella salina]
MLPPFSSSFFSSSPLPPAPACAHHPAAPHHVLLPPPQQPQAQPTNAAAVPLATRDGVSFNNGGKGGHGGGAAAQAAAAAPPAASAGPAAAANPFGHDPWGSSAAAPMCIDEDNKQGHALHSQSTSAAGCWASPSPAAPPVALASMTGRPMRAAAAAAATTKQQQQHASKQPACTDRGGSRAPPTGGMAHVRHAQPMPFSDRELQLMRCSGATFRYMYGEDGLSFKEEVQGSCCCPFCDLECKHGLGLQQHLVASHAHFFYRFILPPQLPLSSQKDDLHKPQGPNSYGMHLPPSPLDHQLHSRVHQHRHTQQHQQHGLHDQHQQHLHHQQQHHHQQQQLHHQQQQQHHHHQQQQQQQQQRQQQQQQQQDQGRSIEYKIDPEEVSRLAVAHTHPGHPHQLIVLVHVPAAMYSPEGRMLVADADIVLNQEQQPARLLWMFYRRLHPTRLFMLNLVPGSPLDQELNYPPSHLTAAPEYRLSSSSQGLAALPIQGAVRGRVKGTRAQGSRGKHPSRLALLRRPPFYELDQAHHLEGRWEGFKSLLERKGGWEAFNRGHEGDPKVMPLTLRRVDVAEGSTRRRTRGGGNGAMNAAAEALAHSGNNMYGYGDGSVSKALYGPRFRSPRFYFHTHSTMPMTCEDLETALDSDDESDEEQWEVRAQRDMVSAKAMTEAERQFMICWNRFGNRRKLFSDYILPQRCEEFVREYWAELHGLQSNSNSGTVSHGESAPAGAPGRYALLMHLLCLFEHALVNGATVERCLRIYDGAH